MNLGLLMEDTLSTGQMEEWFPYIEEKIKTGLKIKLCYLCQTSYVDTEAYDEHHMTMQHNLMLHRQNKTPVLRKHACQLCIFECTGVVKFAEHLKSKKHSLKLNGLRKWKKRTIGDQYSLPEPEDIDALLTSDIIQSVRRKELEAKQLEEEKKLKKVIDILPPKVDRPPSPKAPRSILKKGQDKRKSNSPPRRPKTYDNEPLQQSTWLSSSGSTEIPGLEDHSRSSSNYMQDKRHQDNDEENYRKSVPSESAGRPSWVKETVIREPESKHLEDTSVYNRGVYDYKDTSRPMGNHRADIDNDHGDYRYGDRGNNRTQDIDGRNQLLCDSKYRRGRDDSRNEGRLRGQDGGSIGDSTRYRETEFSSRRFEGGPKGTTGHEYDRLPQDYGYGESDMAWNKESRPDDTYRNVDTRHSRLDLLHDTDNRKRQAANYGDFEDYDMRGQISGDNTFRGREKPAIWTDNEREYRNPSPDRRFTDRAGIYDRGSDYDYFKDDKREGYRYSDINRRNEDDEYKGPPPEKDADDSFFDPFASPVTGSNSREDQDDYRYARNSDSVRELQRHTRIGPHTPDREIDYPRRIGSVSPERRLGYKSRSQYSPSKDMPYKSPSRSPYRDRMYDWDKRDSASSQFSHYDQASSVSCTSKKTPVDMDLDEPDEFMPSVTNASFLDSQKVGSRTPDLGSKSHNHTGRCPDMSKAREPAITWAGSDETEDMKRIEAEKKAKKDFPSNLQGTGLAPASVDVNALLKTLIGLQYEKQALTTAAAEAAASASMTPKETTEAQSKPLVNDSFGDLDDRKRNKPKQIKPPVIPSDVPSQSTPVYMSNSCPKTAPTDSAKLATPSVQIPPTPTTGVQTPDVTQMAGGQTPGQVTVTQPSCASQKTGVPMPGVVTQTPEQIQMVGGPVQSVQMTPQVQTGQITSVQMQPAQSSGVQMTGQQIQGQMVGLQMAEAQTGLITGVIQPAGVMTMQTGSEVPTTPAQVQQNNVSGFTPVQSSAQVQQNNVSGFTSVQSSSLITIVPTEVPPAPQNQKEKEEPKPVSVKNTNLIEVVLGKNSFEGIKETETNKLTTASSLKNKEKGAFSYAEWREKKKQEEERRQRERDEIIRRKAEEQLKKKEIEKKGGSFQRPPDKYEPRPKPKQPLTFNSKPSERTTSSVGRSHSDHRGNRPDHKSSHSRHHHHSRSDKPRSDHKSNAPKAPTVDTAELLIRKTEHLKEMKNKSSSHSSRDDDRYRKRHEGSRSSDGKKPSSHADSSRETSHSREGSKSREESRQKEKEEEKTKSEEKREDEKKKGENEESKSSVTNQEEKEEVKKKPVIESDDEDDNDGPPEHDSSSDGEENKENQETKDDSSDSEVAPAKKKPETKQSSDEESSIVSKESKPTDYKHKKHKHHHHHHHHHHRHHSKHHKHSKSEEKNKSFSPTNLFMKDEVTFDNVDVSRILDSLGIDEAPKNEILSPISGVALVTHNDEFLEVSEDILRKCLIDLEVLDETEDKIAIRNIVIDYDKKSGENVTDELNPKNASLSMDLSKGPIQRINYFTPVNIKSIPSCKIPKGVVCKALRVVLRDIKHDISFERMEKIIYPAELKLEPKDSTFLKLENIKQENKVAEIPQNENEKDSNNITIKTENTTTSESKEGTKLIAFSPDKVSNSTKDPDTENALINSSVDVCKPVATNMEINHKNERKTDIDERKSTVSDTSLNMNSKVHPKLDRDERKAKDAISSNIKDGNTSATKDISVSNESLLGNKRLSKRDSTESATAVALLAEYIEENINEPPKDGNVANSQIKNQMEDQRNKSGPPTTESKPINKTTEEVNKEVKKTNERLDDKSGGTTVIKTEKCSEIKEDGKADKTKDVSTMPTDDGTMEENINPLQANIKKEEVNGTVAVKKEPVDIKPSVPEMVAVTKKQLLIGDPTIFSLLALSIQEEEMRKKIMKTTNSIGKLEAIIRVTQQQLADRQKSRILLLKEEERVRSTRLKMLKGVSKGQRGPYVRPEDNVIKEAKVQPTNVGSNVVSNSELSAFSKSSDTFNKDLLSKLYSNLDYAKGNEKLKDKKKPSESIKRKSRGEDSDNETKTFQKKSGTGKEDWFSKLRRSEGSNEESEPESETSRVKNLKKKKYKRKGDQPSDSSDEDTQSHSKTSHVAKSANKKDIITDSSSVKKKAGRPRKDSSEKAKSMVHKAVSEVKETPKKASVTDLKVNPISRTGIMDLTSTVPPPKKAVKSSAKVDTSSDSDVTDKKQKKEEKMFSDSSSDDEQFKLDIKNKFIEPEKKKRGRPKKKIESESDTSKSFVKSTTKKRSLSKSGSDSDTALSKVYKKKIKKQTSTSKDRSESTKKRGRPRKDSSDSKQRFVTTAEAMRGPWKIYKTINLKTLTAKERRKMQPSVVLKHLTKAQLKKWKCKTPMKKKKRKHEEDDKKKHKKLKKRSDDEDMPLIFDKGLSLSQIKKDSEKRNNKNDDEDDMSSIGPSASQVGNPNYRKNQFDPNLTAHINIKKEIIDDDYLVSETFNFANVVVKSEPDVENEMNKPLSEKVPKSKKKLDYGSTVTVPVEKTIESKAQKFVSHTAAINDMFVWKDFLFTASEDQTACKFDLKTCKCLTTYKGHMEGIQAILVTARHTDKPIVFTGSFDNAVYGFHIEKATIEVKHKFKHKVFSLCEAWGNLYVGLGNGNIACISIKENSMDDTVKCIESAVTCIQGYTDGDKKLLVVASKSGSISLHDADNSEIIRNITGHSGSLTCLQIEDDLLYSGSTDKTLQIHHLKNAASLKTLNHDGEVTTVCVTEDQILTASSEGLIRSFMKKDYQMTKVYYGAGQGSITAMLLHGKKLITGNKEGLAEVQEIHDGEGWKCQFGHCSLTFGLRAHLEHHVVSEHITSLRCHWKDCTEHLSNSADSKEDEIKTEKAAIAHLAKHLEEEAKRFEAVKVDLSLVKEEPIDTYTSPPLVISNVCSMSETESQGKADD